MYVSITNAQQNAENLKVQLLINGIFFFLGGGGDYGFLSMKVAKPPKLI